MFATAVVRADVYRGLPGKAVNPENRNNSIFRPVTPDEHAEKTPGFRSNTEYSEDLHRQFRPLPLTGEPQIYTEKPPPVPALPAYPPPIYPYRRLPYW